MSADILIASCTKDLPYLEYCMRSIDKFASGFGKTVLIVAEDEERMFRKYQRQADLKTYRRVSDPVKWQIQAQAMKCKADMFCEADYIAHIDSDCVFTEPVTPDDYFVGGKPVMLIEEYSRLEGCPWKPVVEHTLGLPVMWETMRRHPQVNPRGVYDEMRCWIQKVHNLSFESFVLAQRGAFPFGFTEHNTIGAFALNFPEWKEKYHWIDVGRNPHPKPKLFQAWSHSPPDKPQSLPSGGHATPLEFYKKLGLFG